MLKVLNDVHIGVIRGAGTTPESQWALRQHILRSFKELLPIDNSVDLMILGDLFDTANVPVHDVLATYEILSAWLAGSHGKLYLVAGNHDLCKSSNVLSSFQFLGKLLEKYRPNRVQVIEKPVMIEYGYVIPHLANQALFDAALEAVPECNFVFAHCNYDNHFAAQSDQSLNMTAEQAKALKCHWIVLGHEHQARRALKVAIPGCQIMTSVSDCLGRNEIIHYEIDDQIWPRYSDFSGIYTEMNWQELKLTDHKFVRVVGSAPAEEATAVVNAIARFRQVSKALVITNAVQIVSTDDSAIFEQSLENIQAFSIWNALQESLPEEDFNKLKGLADA